LRNRLAGADTVFIRRTSILKNALAFIVGIFAAYDNLIILPIFRAAIGIDGDHSPRFFDLFRNYVIAHWLRRNGRGRKYQGGNK
jgi:hypothetical protein